MRILITGGAGFIGSHVADVCLEQGHEVVVVDDLSGGNPKNVPSGARFVQLDIRNEPELSRLIAEVRPDAVSHQAAQVSVAVSTREPQRDAQINIEGTINLLEACVKNNVRRVVFASTGGAIYGEVPEPERAQVGRSVAPISPYACSKFAVENYLGYYRHAFGLESTVLRYANVYGPRQDPHGEAGVVAIFCQRLMAGQPVQINARKSKGDDGCVRDYTFVADVVKGNRMALAGELTQTMVNIGTGVETTTLELARRIEAVIGTTAQLTYGDKRAGDIERSLLEPFPGLGEPTPLAEGIRQTVEWFQNR